MKKIVLLLLSLVLVFALTACSVSALSDPASSTPAPQSPAGTPGDVSAPATQSQVSDVVSSQLAPRGAMVEIRGGFKKGTDDEHYDLPVGAEGSVILYHYPIPLWPHGKIEWEIGDRSIVNFLYDEYHQKERWNFSSCDLVGLKPGTTTLTIKVQSEEGDFTKVRTITVTEATGPVFTYDFPF